MELVHWNRSDPTATAAPLELVFDAADQSDLLVGELELTP